ncbi:MFS transporter [Streptosporangium violaceochromogenes]|nr:MFS transporter [Streptosporangium violaceochromogenes]
MKDIDAMTRTRNPWVVLTVLCSSLLLVVIDITVLYVALPMISTELNPSASQLLWIADVYSLICAPLLIPFATLGDRFGRRRMLVRGYVVFGAASVLAAFAPNVPALIAARALLGLGSAMIMPSTLSMIRQVFDDADARAKALGVWSAVASAGAVIGPLLGGALVEGTWWGAVFLINVPVMLAAVPLALWLVPESPRRVAGRWDATSACLATAGVLGLAYGIKEAGHSGPLAPSTVLSLTAAAVLLVLFVVRQRRGDPPLLDVGLFANPSFSTAATAVVITFLILVGLELLFTQYLQLVLDLSPFAAALRLLPMSVTSVAGSLAGGPLVRRFGAPALIAAGLAGTAVSQLPLVALDTTDRAWLMGLCFAGMGFWLAVVLTASSNALMNAVDVERAGQAAAVEETSYELGGGLGIALLGSVTSAAYGRWFPALPGLSDDTWQAARESLSGAVRAAATLPRADGTKVLDAARETFVAGLHLTLTVSTGLLLAGGLVVVFVFRGRNRITSPLGEQR